MRGSLFKLNSRYLTVVDEEVIRHLIGLLLVQPKHGQLIWGVHPFVDDRCAGSVNRYW